MARREVKSGRIERDQDENPATAHGIATEPLIRVFYGRYTKNVVKEVPFKWHPQKDLNWLGASPDGIVEDEYKVRFAE
jgi:hypothetical protein